MSSVRAGRPRAGRAHVHGYAQVAQLRGGLGVHLQAARGARAAPPKVLPVVQHQQDLRRAGRGGQAFLK